jgi:hypothetical protein
MDHRVADAQGGMMATAKQIEIARALGLNVEAEPDGVAAACHCGGKRKVLALVTSRRTAEEILQNMGILPRVPHRPAKSQAPPQLALAL